MPGSPDNSTQILSDPLPGSMQPVVWNINDPGVNPALGAPAPDLISPPGQDPAGWSQSPPPAAGRTLKNRTLLIVAGGIAAVVVLGGGLVYALTQGSGHKTQTPGGNASTGGAAQQAAAVNEILKSGRTARGHLPARLRTCDDVSAGVSGFQQVVKDRQQELSQSRGLKVDRLRDGARLRRSMVAAYQSSLAADQAYLAWAQEVQARGCGGRIAPLTAHYKDAVSANDKAGPAKRQVVTLWRPSASNHGLPTYAWNRL